MGSAESDAAHPWKARAGAAREAVQRARQEIAEINVKLCATRRVAERAKHETLAPATLQQLLPHRARTFRARAEAPPAGDRDARFAATSAAYHDARTIARPSGDIHRTVMDGLTWWIPRMGRTGANAAPKERLPYHGMLQTRDVAIGGVMLDLGANIGRMSIPRVVFGDVQAAYCVEPDPVNYDCLVRNTLDNGLQGYVLPDRAAIGDRNGTVLLKQAKGHGGHHVVAGTPGEEAIEVPAYTLDTWVGMHQIDLAAVTFIKVDVEGFEGRVLAGAPGVLAHRHIAWQLEISPVRLLGAGDSPTGVARRLLPHFTHFIDLSRSAPPPRVRAIVELPARLADVERTGEKTDVVVYNAA